MAVAVRKCPFSPKTIKIQAKNKLSGGDQSLSMEFAEQAEQTEELNILILGETGNMFKAMTSSAVYSIL